MMNIETIRETADKAYKKQQYRKAKKLYLKVVEKQSDEYYYLQLARCEYAMRNYEEGEVLGRKVLQMNPESVEAMLILAKSFLIREKLDEAECMAQKVITLSENSGDVHAVLAFIKLINGEFGDSENKVLEAIEIEPHSSYAHTVYGILLRSQDRRKEALGEFKLAFQNHQSVGALVNLVTQFIRVNRIKFFILWVLLLICGVIFMNGFVLLGFSIYAVFLGWLYFRNGQKKLAWMTIGVSVFFGTIAGFLMFT